MDTPAREPTPEEIAAKLDEANDHSGRPGTGGRRMLAFLWLIEHGQISPLPDRPAPPPPGSSPILDAQGRPYTQGKPSDRPVIDLMTRCIADIEEEDVEWLWPGRIPLGTVSLVLGRQGDGKSTLLSWLAAVVSTGRAWPDCPDFMDPRSVLILSAEESPGRTIRPRLAAFGADMNRVHVVEGVKERGQDGGPAWFSLARDAGALARDCKRRGDVGLIMVDPLGSYIRGISGYNESETREYLQPTFDVAEEFDLAVVLMAHPNKNAENDILERVSGTGAFTQMVRMSWFLSEDPRDGSRRLLSLMKGNVHGATRTGLAVCYDESRRRLTWLPDPVKLSARQVDHLLQKQAREAKLEARRGPDPVAAEKAQEFILAALAHGPMLQSSCQDQALNVGVKESSFRKGLKRLIQDDGRVTRERGESDGRWWLTLCVPTGDDEAAPVTPAPDQEPPPDGAEGGAGDPPPP